MPAADRPDKTTEKEVAKIKGLATPHSAEAAYKEAATFANDPANKGKLSALREGLGDLLPRLTFEHSQAETDGKSNFSKWAGTDQKLSKEEIGQLSRTSTEGADALFLPEIERSFNHTAKADQRDGNDSVTENDLRSDAERLLDADALAKFLPKSDEWQKRMDVTEDGKVTRADLGYLRKANKDDPDSLRAINALDRLLADDTQELKHSDAKNFIDEAARGSRSRGNAGDVIAQAFNATDHKLFKEIAGAGNIQFNKEQLDKTIAAKEAVENPDFRTHAELAVLKNVAENFGNIAGTDGNVSLEDIRSYQEKSRNAEVLRSVFHDELKENTPITEAMVADRLAQTNAKISSEGNNPDRNSLAERDALKYLQTNFADVSKLAAPADVTEVSESSGDDEEDSKENPPTPASPISGENLERLGNWDHSLQYTDDRDTGALKRFSIQKLFADAPETEMGKGKAIAQKGVDDGKIGIANYGHVRLGYHWNQEGKLDTIVTDPSADNPKAYKRESDGTWYQYPNGLNSPESRMQMQGALGVNPANGDFFQMLNGKFDELSHQPGPGSTFRWLHSKDNATFDQLVRADGSQTYLKYMGDYQKPVEYAYAPPGMHQQIVASLSRNPAFNFAPPERQKQIYDDLAQKAFTSFKPTGINNEWKTTVNRGNGTAELVIRNPRLVDNGTVEFTDAQGRKEVLATNGYQLQQTRDKTYGFDHSGRLASIDWHNNRKVNFGYNEQNQFDKLTYQQKDTAGGIHRTEYHRDGQDSRGLPTWSMFEHKNDDPLETSKDAQGRTKLAFQPYVDDQGNLRDFGRTNPGEWLLWNQQKEKWVQTAFPFDWGRSTFIHPTQAETQMITGRLGPGKEYAPAPKPQPRPRPRPRPRPDEDEEDDE